MIKTKKDLKYFIYNDLKRYTNSTRLFSFLTMDFNYYIKRYIKRLRKTEYYFNNKNKMIKKILFIFSRRKLNFLSYKLQIFISYNTFEEGLLIYHGGIETSGNLKVGKNCTLHGNNCLGNKGYCGSKSPCVGDNVELGFGACIYGDISIGNNVIVGAQSLVNKSFSNNKIIAGIPATEIKK